MGPRRDKIPAWVAQQQGGLIHTSRSNRESSAEWGFWLFLLLFFEIFSTTTKPADINAQTHLPFFPTLSDLIRTSVGLSKLSTPNINTFGTTHIPTICFNVDEHHPAL